MFAKPKAVKLSDGTPLTNLLTAPTVTTTTAKNVPVKTVPIQPKPSITKAPVPGKKQPETKLSDQLK